MGGSVSKSTIKGNKETLDKLDITLSDLLTNTLKKYSELMGDSVSARHEAYITTFKTRGATLEDIKPSQPSVLDTFKAKCTKDVVMIIKDKLKRYPKWALLERGALFNGTKDIPFEIQDPQNMNKEMLCQKMAEIYTAILLSIEIAVKSLFACRKSLDDLSSRVDSSFKTKDNISRDAIGDTSANARWFKSMNELQKIYEKHAKEAKDLFNSLDSSSVLTSEKVDEFKQKLGELNAKMQTLPQQCSMMFEQIDRTPTISKSVADECATLSIPVEQCSAEQIKVKKEEVRAKAVLEAAKLKAPTFK